MQRITRRSLLRSAGMAAAGLVLTGGRALPASRIWSGQEQPRNPGTRALRLAHITDIHVQPELRAPEGFAACLRDLEQLDPRPDLIINGGDAIMDALAARRDRTKLQWNVWHSVLSREVHLPVEHCIGNHDIWGWNRARSGATGTEEAYGKRWAMDELALKSRYRSFDRNGWHIVVLDSTQEKPGEVYEARLDEEQFSWLRDDLARVHAATPVIVISHIPILTACGFFHVPDSQKTGDWVMLGQLMHLDAARIVALFRGHPNVKLCLSGHIHLADRVDYDGVTYLCNGAVCGNWWRGAFHETLPGYAVIDLFKDGSFMYEYRTYPFTHE